MKSFNYFGFVFLLIFSNTLFAETSFPSYMCGKTYQMVRIGDNADRIRIACGDPTSILTKQAQVNTPVTTESWVYTLGGVSINNINISMPSVTVIFQNNQVVKIDKGGSLVTGVSCAANGSVALGDDKNKVFLTCGQPNYVSTQQQMNSSTKSYTQWIYNFGPYKPQIFFNFDDNNLVTQISSGQLGS